MRRKRRQLHQPHALNFQQSKIIFSNQFQSNQSCSICSKPGKALINPCECSTKYHERCLLLYIKGIIKRGLRQNDEVDLSSIKCRRCDNQFHIYFTHKSQYNCQLFMKRMQNNCCNKHITIITLLFIIIVISIVIFINFMEKGDKKLIYGLTALLVIEGVVLLGVLSHFMQTYLVLKQIVLQKVFEMIQLRSLASNNSDDNKISDDCQVVVRS